MKGLLTKDFRILAGQKRYFTIIILIALIFLCSGQPAQIIVGYCTMFGMLFTVNTISYDEFDHGYLFLFTLPVTRKDYVLEKYVFMLLCGGGFWAVSAAAGFVADYIRGDVVSLLEWLMPMFLILLEMTISGSHASGQPEIRYGKSRTATMILGFAVLGAAIAARKLLPENFAGGLRWSAQLNPAAVTAVVFLVSLATLAVSFAGSIRIMQKRYSKDCHFTNSAKNRIMVSLKNNILQ